MMDGPKFPVRDDKSVLNHIVIDNLISKENVDICILEW